MREQLFLNNRKSCWLHTSSALTSVALVDGDHVVAAREHLVPRRHAEVLAPLFAEVREWIEPGAVEAIVCGVGPGPYTGLRVGTPRRPARAGNRPGR